MRAPGCRPEVLARMMADGNVLALFIKVQALVGREPEQERVGVSARN
jgi:hypothetical protein